MIIKIILRLHFEQKRDWVYVLLGWVFFPNIKQKPTECLRNTDDAPKNTGRGECALTAFR